jgi:DNA-directed RNA polymerase specialized sigma24 family protein
MELNDDEYEELDRTIWMICNKFGRFGIYDIEDLHQEGWIFILRELPNYERARCMRMRNWAIGVLMSRFINLKRDKFYDPRTLKDGREKPSNRAKSPGPSELLEPVSHRKDDPVEEAIYRELMDLHASKQLDEIKDYYGLLPERSNLRVREPWRFTETEKPCTKCKIAKNLTEFYRNRQRKDS